MALPRIVDSCDDSCDPAPAPTESFSCLPQFSGIPLAHHERLHFVDVLLAKNHLQQHASSEWTYSKQQNASQANMQGHIQCVEATNKWQNSALGLIKSSVRI